MVNSSRPKSLLVIPGGTLTVVRGDLAHRADHHQLLEDRDVVGPVDEDELVSPVSVRHRERGRCDECVCVSVSKFVGN